MRAAYKGLRNTFKAIFGPDLRMTGIDDLRDKNGELSASAIEKIIPYNEHFLLIDRVTLLEKKRIVAKKKVIGT